MVKVERKYLAHYIDSSFGGTTTAYARLGKDLEEYNIEMNADSETKKNIIGESSTNVKGYEPSGDVDTFYAYEGDPLFEHLSDIVNNRSTGSELETTVVDVLLKGMWNTEGILSFWEQKGEEWGQSIADRFIIPIKELIRKIKYDFKHGNWIALFNEVFSAPFVLMMNGIIDLINGISFDIPDFVPVYGGSHVGFDIPRLELPHLAKGTVIPANYGEFAAILGDNKREREFVTPESSMKQAFIEALREAGLTGGNSGDIVVQIDGREVFRATKREADNYSRTHGGRPAFGGA